MKEYIQNYIDWKQIFIMEQNSWLSLTLTVIGIFFLLFAYYQILIRTSFVFLTPILIGAQYYDYRDKVKNKVKREFDEREKFLLFKTLGLAGLIFITALSYFRMNIFYVAASIILCRLLGLGLAFYQLKPYVSKRAVKLNFEFYKILSDLIWMVL